MARERVRATGEPATADARSVMNSLRRAFLALRVWAQEVEQGVGVSGAQLFVVQQLAEHPEQSPTDLAARTLTSKAAVSVIVSRLVARGLVRRRASPADGRSVILTLTPAGKRLWHRAPESPQRRVLAALGRLPRRELTTFARLFELFVRELGISSLEPRMLFDYDSDGHGSKRAARPRAAARGSRA